MDTRDITDAVRRRYQQAARDAKAGLTASCCGDQTAAACGDPITSHLYDGQEHELPALALRASLGCGNPTLLADLKPGETVLDLGSGGGIDVLLSARRVGPTGRAYGVEMTGEMLAIANENKQRSGLTNVDFLQGQIEQVPLPDHSVDVIISNCVINLSADKSRVLAEAFRVLKPGGRLAVSDVVVRGEVPQAIRASMELWIGCLAGALGEYEYVSKLAKAGFEDIGIEVARVYRAEDARALLTARGHDVEALATEVDGAFVSAFIRARKPAHAPARGAAGCCASTCCH
jgi:arsenite methyltransferase